MNQNALEMQHITKEFPGVRALKDISLSVRRAEIHAICGENGAGKSTLIKILSGVYPHGSYDGEIFIDGQERAFHTIKDAERAGIATIYQELALFKKLSIAENIFMGNTPSRLGIVDWDRMHFETGKWLSEVGLKINPEEQVGNLGVGQQQLVEIAKALSKDARILILDEPTSALAESEVEVLMAILRKLQQKGVTSIYISHKLSEIMDIGDRITVMRDGELISTEAKGETNVKKLIFQMVGRTLDNLFPKEKFQKGAPVLEVESLSLRDPENPETLIIKNASFQAYAGEILGIAGLMGSGRTELATSIFGINARYRTGEIRVNGKKVEIGSPVEAIANGLVYLSEDRKRYGLVLPMSVKENITLASLKKVAGLAINQNAEIEYTNKYIRYLDIRTPSAETKAMNLSGGNQQKVVVGKWLMTEPRILLLDEVTRGIDVGAKYEIYKIMNKLVDSGVVVIMISSEMPEILGMCDRILVMREGMINGEFLREEATQEKIMQSATMAKEDVQYAAY
jgi:D-xylose transport system ATP-binding protein